MKFFLLRCQPFAEVIKRLGRQPALLGRKILEHVQIIEVAERLAKVVQSFRLRVQRFRPGAGQQRELVSQIDNAGAQCMQRRRILAFESDKTAPLRLAISARYRVDNLLSSRQRLSSIRRPAGQSH